MKTLSHWNFISIFQAEGPFRSLMVEQVLREADRTSCRQALATTSVSVSNLSTQEKRSLFFDLLLLSLLKTEALSLDLNQWGLTQEILNPFERSLLTLSEGRGLTQKQILKLEEAVAATEISSFHRTMSLGLLFRSHSSYNEAFELSLEGLSPDSKYMWRNLFHGNKRLQLGLQSGFLQVNETEVDLTSRPQLLQLAESLFQSPTWNLEEMATRLGFTTIPQDLLRLLRDLVRQFNAEIESITGLAKTLILTREGLRLTPFVCLDSR